MLGWIRNRHIKRKHKYDATNIEMVIFDFDGTIGDTIQLLSELGNDIVVEQGYERVTDEQINHLRNIPIRQALKEIDVPLYKILPLGMELRKRLMEKITEIEPNKGIGELLDKLDAAGITYGMATSNDKKLASKFLENQGWLERFMFVHSEVRIFRKDKMLKSILKDYNLDKKKVVYVGDEIRDIDASHRAGISIVSVTWGLNGRDILLKSQPDQIADTPQELYDRLGLE